MPLSRSLIVPYGFENGRTSFKVLPFLTKDEGRAWKPFSSSEPQRVTNLQLQTEDRANFIPRKRECELIEAKLFGNYKRYLMWLR